jgi:ribonucleotide monophosphatase NagD (HAD superfamily)
MGINSSIDTALVLTGVTNKNNILNTKIKPTYVIQSILSLIPGELINDL